MSPTTDSWITSEHRYRAPVSLENLPTGPKRVGNRTKFIKYNEELTEIYNISPIKYNS